MLKRITQRIRKAWEESAPANSGAPAAAPVNPYTRLVGRLALRNAVELRRSLWRLLKPCNRIVALDCAQIRFMDGSALAVLIEFAQACQGRGITLRMIEPSLQVLNTFSMYGMDDVLVSLADFNELELDGMLVVLDEDFADSIRLPALVIEEDELPDSIRIAA